MFEPVSIYTTFADLPEAKRIANNLVKRKLVACANLFPCQSIYLWRGQTEEASEVAAIFKTVEEKCEIILAEIKEQSSYESPTIFVSKIDQLSSETSDWLREVLGYRI